jgi:hypothetical protein
MNQLRKDTDLEVARLNHSVEAVREKLNEEENEHRKVIQKRIEKNLSGSEQENPRPGRRINEANYTSKE